ncbi:thioredoxin domain-containing protein 6 isoform X2 [Pantherophis guttatus]|uniref:Thioredoxin domain-containing protein 6 isoform X2 n=1 Tax=Pantherophis guttatus TaxID=94885 RepID=A0A6P9DWV1_PANGU|nr:thioredoxin domain-containing protein 6 isoform X2 [Pantherophis guttatus]
MVTRDAVVCLGAVAEPLNSIMASRKREIALQMVVNNQEHWEEFLGSKGLIVVDAYQGWCGPCKTVVNLFKKIRNEVGSDLLHFAVAEVDSIDALEKYRGKCEPTFLFYGGGELVAVVRGANAPLLQKTILEQLQAEKRVLDHGAERVVARFMMKPSLNKKKVLLLEKGWKKTVRTKKQTTWIRDFQQK